MTALPIRIPNPWDLPASWPSDDGCDLCGAVPVAVTEPDKMCAGCESAWVKAGEPMALGALL